MPPLFHWHRQGHRQAPPSTGTRADHEFRRRLVRVAGDDATNIVVTLSARALNSDLLIVARAIQAEATGSRSARPRSGAPTG